MSGCALVGYDPLQGGGSAEQEPSAPNTAPQLQDGGNGNGNSPSSPAGDGAVDDPVDASTQASPWVPSLGWTGDPATPDINPQDGYPSFPGELPAHLITDASVPDPDSGGGDTPTPAQDDDAGTAIAPMISDGLRNRYSFNGVGTEIIDSVSGAHGTALGGAALDGSGMLTLDGIDDYVNLPNGLISSLQSTTLVAWFTWWGSSCSTRVFDFGNSTFGEDMVDSPTYSLFYAPRICVFGWDFALSRYDTPISGETVSIYDLVPASNQRHQIALVIDSDKQQMRYYLNGVLRESAELLWSLSSLDDVNNWLGRSQWSDVATLSGVLHEFRVYDKALNDTKVEKLYEAGPDALP